MSKVLITGIGGFVGQHLARYLDTATPGSIIYGIARSTDLKEVVGLRSDLGSRLELLECDLMDAVRVKQVVGGARPDLIFHLAAQSFVPASWQDPLGTLVNNIGAQVNLFEAILAWGGKPAILVVGSNEEYGMVEASEVPIKEGTPLRPANPYAVSKVAQDMLGYQYHVARGLAVVRVRPFNHLGPGQSDRFVASNFAKQIAEAELGLREPVLEVGDLEAQRDFTDVRDIVRGYYLALVKGQPGEVYNLGSERAVTIRQLLDALVTLSRVPLRIEKDPERLRPSEVPHVLSDCSKFRAVTGWRAEIPLEKSLADLLDYWRQRSCQRSAISKGNSSGRAESL